MSVSRQFWWLFWACWFLALGCGGGSAPGAKGPAGDARGAIAPASAATAKPAKAPAEVAAPTRTPAQWIAYTEPGDIPHLEVAGEPTKRLPLEHTRVKARLTGFVAEVEVAQTYTNPYSDPIEAVYIFPLPENSAVNHMRMVIGKRTIEADVMERREARRTYEEAKASGHTAALLEQERPNVFTQSVANLEPGKQIDVVVRYVQDLTYDDGQYEFVFPMVVGPRFMPGTALPGPQSGQGTHADTAGAPDASRISPPIVGKGQRTGHDISIEVIADGSVAVGSFEVPTHRVVTQPQADGTVRIALAEAKSIPNRDFVLRYRVAAAKPKATMYVTPVQGSGGGYFSLVLHPPKLDVNSLVGQRELIFVVDVSGSMSGKPLAMCQSAMREALGQIRPVDTFNIITFAGASQQAFPRPVPANQTNLKLGFGVISGLRAGGGTYMRNAIDAALGQDVEPGRHRYVFFLTDGYVGNEDEIIAAAGRFVGSLESKRQRARVFGFGVGSSVNRYLLDGLSRAGKGIAVYASTREDPARATNQFYHYIDRTALTDLRPQWGGLTVSEVYPAVLPDLFASHPVILHGRYQGTPGRVSIQARAGKHTVVVPVDVRPAQAAADPNQVMGALWARSRVTDLEERLWDGSDRDALRAQILQLGLDHDLVTRYTSLVAVDRTRKVGDGRPTTVVQPVEEPEGVDVEMAGGVRANQGAVYGPRGSSAGFGAGGLGLTGIGAAGGGVGHGAGFGSGHGRLGGSHKSRAPKVRMGAATVSGAQPTPSQPAASPPSAAPTAPAVQASVDTDEAADAALPEPEPEPAPAYDPTAPVATDDASDESATAPEQADGSDGSGEPRAEVEPKRGCGCRLPSSPGPVRRNEALLLAALGSLLWWRRRLRVVRGRR